MSEHWKSTPKYWCKHCSTYVKDTPFEKKQHEATGKHQGNLRRFLNGIQKDHAKNEREKHQAKLEVERLNRITGISSTASNTPASSSNAGSKVNKPTSASLSVADQKRQWAQLAELGIAPPDKAGVDGATPGGWQTVSQKVVDEPAHNIDDKLNIGVRKRKFEDQEEEGNADEPPLRRGWGNVTKQYPGSASGHDDLDALVAASVFKEKKSLQSPSKDATEMTMASIPKSESVPHNAENSGEVDPPLLKQDPSGTATSGILEAPYKEDKSPGHDLSELQTAIPHFKKRRPKR